MLNFFTDAVARGVFIYISYYGFCAFFYMILN